jgi:hypothetical protein
MQKNNDPMDDVHERAEDDAWDKEVDRLISNMNQAVEKGLKGEALAALHGLHVTPANDPTYEVDDRSDNYDQETLREKTFSRLIRIEGAITRNRDLPDDMQRTWIAILQKCYPAEANSINLLRDLRRDMDSWQEIDPESALALLGAAVGAVATMIEIYQRRFSRQAQEFA